MSGIRWRNQYQRIADVLQQRVDQLTPNPYLARVEQRIADAVAAAPPLSEAQRALLAILLRPPPADAVINDPVALAKAAKIMRGALSRSNRV